MAVDVGPAVHLERLVDRVATGGGGHVHCCTRGEYVRRRSPGGRVESRLHDLINVYFVAIEAGSVPSNPKVDGRLILDPERSLHYRYGAETECLYLVRPDGYVGYRSEPATTSAFHDYLGRIFSS
jgi:hypothetical protein